jgi:NADH pyrophosphatase NudC (nudix superfamily)
MHRVVWEFYNGKVPKGHHIHHKDENSWNNKPENLECIEASLHLSEHGKKRDHTNFQKAGCEAAKEWHASPEGYIWHSENGIKCWVNRKYKTKFCDECGKQYETRHGGLSRFCHNNCKAKSGRRTRKLRASTGL